MLGRLIFCSHASRYTDGNETYTFVPAEPVGARSLTIYRNSGDIVLNRECYVEGFGGLCSIHYSPQHPPPCDVGTVGQDNIRHSRNGDARDVYVLLRHMRGVSLTMASSRVHPHHHRSGTARTFHGTQCLSRHRLRHPPTQP